MKEVYRLQVRNVSKSYADCLANNRVSLRIEQGEIHALLGENGAGKSTLMKIIYGLVRPDAGEVFWEGEKVNLNSPAQARMFGVGIMFQHFSLFETLTVTENIALALPKTEKWDLSRVEKKIRILSNEYGLSVNPDRPIHTLAVGERQRVEVIRCLFQSTKLLILDEPTAVLSPQEVEKLFAILRQIAANGCSILFGNYDVAHRRRLGLAYAPEDRLSKGVVPNLSLQENALLTAYGQGLERREMIRFGKLKNWTVRICAAFNVKQAGVNSTAASLTSQNLQSFYHGAGN